MDKENHYQGRIYEEQIYSVIGVYIRHRRIYTQNGMISDTVGYKQVIRHAKQ
jgi:hypothetical protein